MYIGAPTCSSTCLDVLMLACQTASAAMVGLESRNRSARNPVATAVPSNTRAANREDPTSNSPTVVYKPTTSTNESSGPGLRFSWTVYRGKAASVSFKPDQLETWIDTRSYAHSPWAPPYIIPVPPADGRYVTEVVFNEPGTYVLRGIASDSAVFTYQNVTVTVTK